MTAHLQQVSAARRDGLDRRWLLGVIVAGIALLGCVSEAHAGVAISVVPNLPSPLVVGQSGVASNLTIGNFSNGAEATLNVTLGTISVVVACGTLSASTADCPAASVDPGTVNVSPTGTGEAGTACAGTTFTITDVDATEDKYQLTPGTAVVLGPSGGASATCVIDFTVDVVRMPTKDADPGAGVQTAQIGFASGTATDSTPGTGLGSSEVTVSPATPTVATAVSPPSIALGGSFDDTATLTSPAGAVAPTGTITFNVYEPADTTCTGVPGFTSTNPLNAAGTSATSGAFAPTAAGTYRVIANYSGDANYNAVSTACSDPAEAEVVGNPQLTIATAVSPTSIVLGAAFHDTATLTPPEGAPAPTGTVTFDAFGPGDPTCSAAPVLASTNALSAAGTSATSGTFTPTGAGAYHVIATYNGDANYGSIATSCSDPGEVESVAPAPLPIVTTATSGAGGTLSDTATLGPAPAGAAVPTGTVTFTVFGPSDPTCSGAVEFTSTNAVNADGASATSATFTAPQPGTYRFVAAYGGDANYAAVMTACNDPNESVTVTSPPTPAIGVTKAAQPASEVEPGGTFTFTVAVTNPSTDDPITIETLLDNIYGDVTATAGSSCGALIGVTLAPGATSQPCSFPGTFTGKAGDSLTDTVTAGGRDPSGLVASATASATVRLTAAIPTITSLRPSSGPGGGGTPVTISGTGLTSVTAVMFGSTPARGFTVDGPTQMTAIAPPGSGTVAVTATTSAGTSATSSTDQYTYVPPPMPVVTTGTATVLGSSSARFAATVNPQGLETTMHFEYAFEQPGATGSAIAYDAQTPDQPVGTDLADHAVTASVAGLLPNSTYHLRAVATNPSGTSRGADVTFKTSSDPPPPPPVLAKKVNAGPVKGVVYVLLPGTGHVAQAHASAAKGVGFIPLTEARQLPVGTIFDTTNGTVSLTTATSVRGRTQTGQFGAGLFKLLQNRSERGVTDVDLVVSATARRRCGTIGKAAHTSSARALPKTVLTLVRSSASGRYRTRGRYSSATVRGTVWTTSERCDGTLTAVKRGVVLVVDFRRKRQIVLRAGRSYLAKAA